MEDYWNLRASLKSTPAQANVATSALNQTSRNSGQMSQPYIAQEVCVIERTIRQEPMTLNSCNSGRQGLSRGKLSSELLAIVSGKQQHVGLPSCQPSVTSRSTYISSHPQLSMVNSTNLEGLVAWPANTPSSLYSGNPLSGSRSSSGVTTHASQCGQVQELSVSTSERLVTGAHDSMGFGPVPELLKQNMSFFNQSHEQGLRTNQQIPPPQWLTETVSRQQRVQSMVTSLPMFVGNSALQKIPQTTSNLQCATANHPRPVSNVAPTGRPLVFCANFAGSLLSGELCLTGAGRLGVVCACHNMHMSVTKFTQHAGIYTGNPGEAVFLQGGLTLVKWRKLFFQRYGVKLPEDNLGWDWNDLDSLEPGKANRTSITQCSHKDFDVSSGGKPSATKSKTNVWDPSIAAGSSSVLHGSQTVVTSKHSTAQVSCGQGVLHKQQENLSQNLGRELRPATTCVEFQSSHFIPDPAQQGLSRNQATAGGLNSLHNTSKSAQIAMNEYHNFISDGGRQYLSSGQQVSAGGNNIKQLNYPRNNWNDGKDNQLKEKDNSSSSVELRLGQPSQYTQPTLSSISSSMLSASSIEHQKSLFSEHIMQRAWDAEAQRTMQNLSAGGIPKISGNLERVSEQLHTMSKNQSQHEGAGKMQSTCMDGLVGQAHQSGITAAFLLSGRHLVNMPMYHAANLNASVHHSNQNLSSDQQTNKVAKRVLYEQSGTDKSVMQCMLQADQLRKCMMVENGRLLESQSLGALAQVNNQAANQLLEKAIQASLKHRSTGMDFSSTAGKGKIMPAGPSDCHMKSLFPSQVPSSTTRNNIKADPDSSSKGVQYSGSTKQLQQVPTSAVTLRNQQPPLVYDPHLEKISFKNSVTNEELRGKDLANDHLEGLQSRAERLVDNGRKDQQQQQVIINKQDWVQMPLKVENDLNSKSPKVVSLQNNSFSNGQCGRSDGKASDADCEGFQSRAESLGDNGKKEWQQQQVIINKQEWVQRPLKVENDLNSKNPKVVSLQNSDLPDSQCGRSDGQAINADCDPQPHADPVSSLAGPKHMGECSGGKVHKPLSGGESSTMEVKDIQCNCFKCQTSSSTPRGHAVTRIAGQICLKDKGCQRVNTELADKDVEIGDVQKCLSRDSDGQPLFSEMANRTQVELSDDVLSENAAKGTVGGADSRREPNECSETCSKSSENVMSGLSDEGQDNDEQDSAFQGQLLSKPLGQNGVCDKPSAIHKSHSSDSANLGAATNPVSIAGDLTKLESPSSLHCPSSSNVAAKLMIKSNASQGRGQQQSMEAEEKNDESKIENVEQKQQINLKWKQVGSDADAGEFKKRKTMVSCEYSAEQSHPVQDADLGHDNQRGDVRPEVAGEDEEDLCESTAGKEKRLKRKRVLVGNCSPSCVSGTEVKGIKEETVGTAEEEGPTPQRKNRTLIIRVPQQVSLEEAAGDIHTKHDLSEAPTESAVHGSDDLLSIVERKKLGEGPHVGNISCQKALLEKRAGSPTAESTPVAPPKAVGSIVTKKIRSVRGGIECPSPRNRRIVSLSNILKRRAERIDPQYRAVSKQVSMAEVEGSHERIQSSSWATVTSPKDIEDRTEDSSSGNGPLPDSNTLSVSQKDETHKVRSLFELTGKKPLTGPDLEVSDTTDNCAELSAACNRDMTTVQTKLSLPFPCPFSESPCPVPRSGRSVRSNALSKRSFQCHRSKDAQADVGKSNAALQEKRLSQTKVDCCGEADVARLLQPKGTCTPASRLSSCEEETYEIGPLRKKPRSIKVGAKAPHVRDVSAVARDVRSVHVATPHHAKVGVKAPHMRDAPAVARDIRAVQVSAQQDAKVGVKAPYLRDGPAVARDIRSVHVSAPHDAKVGVKVPNVRDAPTVTRDIRSVHVAALHHAKVGVKAPHVRDAPAVARDIRSVPVAAPHHAKVGVKAPHMRDAPAVARDIRSVHVAALHHAKVGVKAPHVRDAPAVARDIRSVHVAALHHAKVGVKAPHVRDAPAVARDIRSVNVAAPNDARVENEIRANRVPSDVNSTLKKRIHVPTKILDSPGRRLKTIGQRMRDQECGTL